MYIYIYIYIYIYTSSTPPPCSKADRNFDSISNCFYVTLKLRLCEFRGILGSFWDVPQPRSLIATPIFWEAKGQHLGGTYLGQVSLMFDTSQVILSL